MKHQALFSSEVRSKKIKVSSAAILLCALRFKSGTSQSFKQVNLVIK